MEREVGVVCFCPVIGEVATRSIVFATRFFDMPPNTFVFGGNLVPVGAVIFGDFAKNGNVAEELGRAVGQCRKRKC